MVKFDFLNQLDIITIDYNNSVISVTKTLKKNI